MMETGSLFKKRIILGVTGSIAAVETVRLAHALRREGASVTARQSEGEAGENVQVKDVAVMLLEAVKK